MVLKNLYLKIIFSLYLKHIYLYLLIYLYNIYKDILKCALVKMHL